MIIVASSLDHLLAHHTHIIRSNDDHETLHFIQILKLLL